MIEEGDIFIDDYKLQDLGIIVTLDSDEPALSGIRGNTISLPGEHGSYDYGATLEPMVFSFSCIFESQSYNHMKNQIKDLKNLLLDSSGKPKHVKLKMGDQSDRYYDVRIDSGINVKPKGLYGYFTLVLTSFDACAYSVAKNDEVTWGSTLITFTADYALGHMGSGARAFTAPGTTLVTLSGHNLRPIIHIFGTGVNVSVGWGGKTFSLGSFANTSWLVDLNEYVVLKNGSPALHLIKGDWLLMQLTKGDNTIAVNGSGLDLTFRVEYRDRYY